eukprot:1146487-Pelagomonas_calceolata.AAC.4
MKNEELCTFLGAKAMTLHAVLLGAGGSCYAQHKGAQHIPCLNHVLACPKEHKLLSCPAVYRRAGNQSCSLLSIHRFGSRCRRIYDLVELLLAGEDQSKANQLYSLTGV